MSKKGQVTIWVIVTFIIIAGVVLFFLFARKSPIGNIGEGQTSEIEEFLEGCVENSVSETIETILPQGGFVYPENFKLWNSQNVSYLCRNNEYYRPCINQRPQYIAEIRGEIGKELLVDLETCLEDLEAGVADSGESFEYADPEIKVDLVPGRILINLALESSSSGEIVETYGEFDFDVQSPIYDLALVAGEIASQESKYCYFEYVGYQLTYPRFRITKDSLSDDTKIYSIEDTRSGQILNIAIRSCANPPGI